MSRGISSPGQAPEPAAAVGNAVSAVKHQFLIEAAVGALTLRLSHTDERADAGAAVFGAGDGHTPFDLVLSAEGFKLHAASTNVGTSLRGELSSILVYVGAGFVPRAILLQLSMRTFLAAGIPATRSASRATGSSAATLAEAAQPSPSASPLSLHVELVGAELSLVRRNQHQLEVIDAEIDRGMELQGSYLGPPLARVRSNEPRSASSSYATYAAIINELKADATYLCTPVHAHVAFSSLTRTPMLNETPISRARTLVRVGSASVSVSPSDAALVVSLVQAVQAGAASIVTRISAGLAHYFLARGVMTGPESSASRDRLGQPLDLEGDHASLSGESDADDASSGSNDEPWVLLSDDSAAMALSVAQSGLRRAAGARVQRAAAFVMAAAEAQSTSLTRQDSAGATPVDTRSALRVLNDALAPIGDRDTLDPWSAPFEFRVLVDRVQITLFSNMLAGSSMAADSDRRHHGDSGNDMLSDGGVLSYRVQILRVDLAHFGVSISPSALSVSGFLGAFYFNDAISSWEPALEPWPFLLSLGVETAQRLDAAGSETSSSASTVLTVRVQGVDSLNLTVSGALLSAIPSIQGAIGNVLSAMSEPSHQLQPPPVSNPAVSVPVSAASLPDGRAGRARIDSNASGQAQEATVQANLSQAALAFAPFIFFNETGCAVQLWRPEPGLGIRVGSDAPPNPAFIACGEHLPVSATYLALLEQDELRVSTTNHRSSSLSETATADGVISGDASLPFTGPGDRSAKPNAPVPVLERPVPPLDDTEDAAEDTTPDVFQLGAFARLAQDEQTAFFKTFDDGAQQHTLTGNVAVIVNLQLAGYQPVLRQPINHVGATHVVMQPLEHGQLSHGGVDLLSASDSSRSRSNDARTWAMPTLDEEDDCAARLPGASAYDARDGPSVLSGWRTIVAENRASGAVWPLHVEFYVEKSAGGAKVVRARSLVHVCNSTRTPVVVRMVPPAAPYFLRKCGSAEHAGTPFDSRDFCGALDKTASRLARQLYVSGSAAVLERQAIFAARAQRNSQGAINSSSASEAAAASARQLFSVPARALTSSGLGLAGALPTAPAPGHGQATTVPTSFEFSCWDAAAAGLPLDRVILPGRSWRIPVPFAANSRLFFRPALELPSAVPGLQLLPVASSADDGHVTLWTPQEALVASVQKPHIRGGGSSKPSRTRLAGAFEDEDTDDDGDGSAPPARVPPPPVLPSRRSIVAPSGPVGPSTPVGRRDDSAASGAASVVRDDGISECSGDDDDDAPNDVAFIADPRYDWSLFEGTEGAPSDILNSSSRHSGQAVVSQPANPTRAEAGGVRGFFNRLRGAKAVGRAAVAEVDTASTDDLSGELGDASVGIDLQALCHGSISRILEAMLGEDDAASPSANANGDNEDADNIEGGPAVTPLSHSRSMKSVAVCPRSRDRFDKTASAAASAASRSEGLGDAGFSAVNDNVSVLLSHAFFYISGRVDMVGVAGARARQPEGGVQTARAAQATDADRELEELMRGAAAVVTLVVRAPVEIQNALACNITYELGIPRFLVAAASNSSSTRTRGAPMSSPEPAPSIQTATQATPQKPSSKMGKLFSALRGKEPATEQAPVSVGTSTPSRAVFDAAVAADLSDDYVVIASGSLAPAQSLSLLYGHPDPPVMATALVKGVSGGGRSRARYKQRLVAARYVRALSLRLRVPGSSFEWSSWLGLWTATESPERTDMVTFRTAAGSSLQVLPPLLLSAEAGIPTVASLVLSDLSGRSSTLHVEHALSQPSDMLMQSNSRGGSAVHTLTLAMTVFCKFWLCNATGLPVTYSSGRCGHLHVLHTWLGISMRLSRGGAGGVREGHATRSAAAGQAYPVTEECFENQRFSMFKWSTRLLPTDRPVWSDRYGSASTPRESFMLPSSEWTWAGSWLVVTGEDTDTEGWQYHLDFPRGSDNGWSALRNPAHFVRRRRWVRLRPSVFWHVIDHCSPRRWTRTRLPPSGASGAGNALVSAARHDLTLAASLPLVDGGASSGVVSDDGAGVELDSAAVLIPATASTLLALGIFMWGPPVDAGDLCSVRIGNSEWSRPWGLRTTVGRPALIVLKDPPCTASERKSGRFSAQYDVVASARPCTDAMDDNSSALDASGGRDGSALMLGGGTMIMSSQLGDVFRRSTLVTLSPRFVIVNRIDVIGLSDVFGQYLTGARNAWVGSNSDRFGVFVLQIAQAGARDANGVSQPHAAVLQHLSGLASRGVGGERSYDIGTTLAQRLKLNQLAAHPHSASPESALVAGLADLRASRVSACTTSVPLVQSVPPGEHAPLQWGLAMGESAASQNVCFRVVRLARPVTLDDSLSSQPPVGATLVVPVTDWSGAVDLGQVAEVPIRLRGATGAVSRLLHEGNPLPEVVLRVAVRSHRKRGTAMVVVTADAGVKPAAGMLGALSAFISEEATEAPPPRHNRSMSSGLGGLQPLLWASGVGEITVAEMQVVLVNERAVMAARRLWVDRAAAISSADTSAPAARAPVYRIDNHTLDTFTIAQKGVVGFATRPPLVVPPRCSVVFAWDEPEIPLEAVAAASTAVLPESSTGIPGEAAAGAGGASSGGVSSGAALRRASSDGATSSHGGGSRLRILVRAVTTPLKPAEGPAPLAARGPPSESVMDVDLNNVALAHSLRLPPGRVLDEESAEALLGATGAGEAVAGSLLAEQSPPGTPGRQSGGAAPVGSGRAVWARPLLYGSTVFVRGHGGGAVSWALGPLHLSPCLWPVVHLASGVVTCSAPLPAFPGGPLPPDMHRSVPAGSPVLAAQCRLVEDDPGVATAATPTADSGSSAAPISFECANRLFAWPGLRAAAASTRAAASGSGAAPGEHGGVTVRYGDLVMIRHDAVVGAPVTAGSASPTAEAAGYAASVQDESADEDMSAEVSAVRSQPLYLVSHRDGRVDWVQASDSVVAARRLW